MSEWRETTVSKIIELVGGGTPKTKIPEYWNGDIPWLSVVDFNTGNKFVFKTEKKITQAGLENSSTKLLEKGDVIISARGTVGVVAMLGKQMAFNQSCYGVKAIDGKSTNNYVYYLLKDTVSNFLQIAHGGVFDTITRDTFKEIDISLPPLPEQKAIAAVLSSLDDKIDLLHRQNKTLEQMAETLFRQWFVEEAGEDWEEKPLKEICTILNGFAFKSPTYQNDGQLIIRTMNFSDHWIGLDKVVFISHELAEQYSKYYLKRKDFLLVMVGASLGNFALVTKDILPALQNQNMWCFRAKENTCQHFLNFALRKLVDDNLHGASGSARQFFQKGVFYELPILFPDLEKMNKFERISEDYFKRVENNREQIRTLQSLRDILLPKLMSGEVRVSYDKEASL